MRDVRHEPKLVDCGRHLNIEIITCADVKEISGEPGNYRVKILRRARYVDEDKCTGCGDCVANCPTRYVVKPPIEGIKYDAALNDEDDAFLSGLLQDGNDVEGNLLATLQKINTKYRYLPENMLKGLSNRTGMKLARLISVASFYNAFSLEPRGEHTISVCTGTACHVKGAERILKRFGEILGVEDGQTSKDGSSRCRR